MTLLKIDPQQPETTGRYIVTFRDGGQKEAISALVKSAGIEKASMINTADFGDTGLNLEQARERHCVIYEHLGMALLTAESDQLSALSQDVGEGQAILAIEQEGYVYALGNAGLSIEYLRGFRDAATALYTAAQTPDEEPGEEATVRYEDSASFTWGLQATSVNTSRYSGRGIKVAVLDTGLDLSHPDFTGRSITQKSFVSGVTSVQDGNGHGTHCTGTACGPLTPTGSRRYGVAYGSRIFIGKVLSDEGSGSDGNILAAMDWAVANKCHVVSMSLGANIPTTSVAYESAGQRALNAGCLIIAAAGNNAKRSAGYYGFVGRPANSSSIMAMGAVDSNLRVADFSARDTRRESGTAVDIAAPGVKVYSTWPMPTKYNTISGTSMATPHVAGIAALWAEKTGAKGASLYHYLVTNARALSAATVDVGRGLVRAP